MRGLLSEKRAAEEEAASLPPVVGHAAAWRRTGPVLVAAVPAALILLTLPATINPYRLFLAALIAVYATAGLGLTVVMGWTGQIVLAQSAFFGLGAYVTVHLHGLGVPWPLAAAAAALAAAAVGAVLAFPVTRLSGFYLAIATLAFAELLRLAFVEADGITGGIAGRSVPPFRLAGLDPAASQWYLALAVAASAAVVAWRIGTGSVGRCLRAVRDAEVATGSLAISASRWKVVAFAVSGALAALAGAVFGQLQTFLTPEIFGVGLLIQLLVVAFVGGVTYVAGPFLGAAFVVVVRELLQEVGAWQRLAYAVALVAVVRFLPDGLAGVPAALRRQWRPRRPGAAEQA